MPISYYDDNAEALAQQYDSLDPDLVHKPWAHLLPGRKVGLALDVGAGTGRDAAWLADMGWEVVAVEPSDLVERGRSNTAGRAVVWHRDKLPELKKVREVGYRFDLILLSAVWQHISPKQRERAFRILTELLNPGGLLVISLRFGSDPEENERRGFHEVSREELEHFARERALVVAHWTQVDDIDRADLGWGYLALQSPDDGTGGLALLRHIIINDNKSATYKLGMLRALTRVAEAYPGCVLSRNDVWVEIPLGLVGLVWLQQYKPLILYHRLPQLPSANPGFAKAPFYALADLPDPDMHIGASLTGEWAKTLMQALRHSCETIAKMPAHYITYPGTGKQIFEAQYRSPGRGSRAIRLNNEFFAHFGSVRVPVPLWQTLGQFGCWLEPAIINEWLNLMRGWNRYIGEHDRMQAGVFRWGDEARFTRLVRGRLDRLTAAGDRVVCTWTGRRSAQIDIDHTFPWSRWPNNDLWNLVPAARRINSQKSDKLATVAAFTDARANFVAWWDRAYIGTSEEEQFWEEAALALPGLCHGVSQSTGHVFEAMLHQRARIKSNQQLPDWAPS